VIHNSEQFLVDARIAERHIDVMYTKASFWLPIERVPSEALLSRISNLLACTVPNSAVRLIGLCESNTFLLDYFVELLIEYRAESRLIPEVAINYRLVQHKRAPCASVKFVVQE